MGNYNRAVFGIFLIILPFIGVLGFCIRTVGIKQTVSAVLLVMIISGCVVGGLHLLLDNNSEKIEMRNEKNVN